MKTKKTGIRLIGDYLWKLLFAAVCVGCLAVGVWLGYWTY